MAFTNFTNTNNAESTLAAWIGASTLSVIVKTWEGALFPSTFPFLVTMESRDSDGNATKREIAKCTWRSTDTLTIVRSQGTCVQDDTADPKVQNTTAYSFSTGDTIRAYRVAEDVTDIKTEIARLETDKADDSAVVHLTWAESVWGVKTFDDDWAESTTNAAPSSDKKFTNKKYVDDQVIAATILDKLTNDDFTNWEDIAAWEAVFIESWETFANATSVQNVWDVTNNTRVTIKQFWTWVAWTTLKLSLKKFVSPWVDLSVRIETDNAWEPSGTLIDANATSTVTAASLSTSLADTTVTLAWSVTVTKWDVVWIVLNQVGDVVNWTNYYGVGYSTRHTTTRLWETYNWAARSSATNNSYYTSSDLFLDKLLSLTDADYLYKTQLFWLSSETLTEWGLLKTDIEWINASQTWLTYDSEYFLSDTPGAISASPWTMDYKIWKAISTTQIEIKKRANSNWFSGSFSDPFALWPTTVSTIVSPWNGFLVFNYTLTGSWTAWTHRVKINFGGWYVFWNVINTASTAVNYYQWIIPMTKWTSYTVSVTKSIAVATIVCAGSRDTFLYLD